MAKISYDAFQRVNTERENNSGNIGFFSLKNDGDEAVVRIMHDSGEDYDIVSVHSVQSGGKYIKVGCLGDHSKGDCPMCSPNLPQQYRMQYRMFVHMINYVKDENGNIVSKPVVWERSASQMSTKLNAMLQEYGPLSDCVFKIRRNGKPQDKNTTYEIMLANPNVYRPDLYPKDASVFDGFTVSGRQVINKTAEEMNVYLSTGSFPEKATNSDNTATAVPHQNQNGDADLPWVQSSTNRNTPQGFTTQGGTSARPTRYY